MQRLGSLLIATLALAVSAVPAVAYDETWYLADYWPGEYPQGFSVTASDVVLPGRKNSDPSLPFTRKCQVTKGATFHPWNEDRDALYRTYSKIVRLKVSDEFVYEFTDSQGNATARTITKSDRLEYLIYQGEGYFYVRYQGIILTAGQDLFDHVEPVGQSQFVDDEWVRIPCGDGKHAWVLLSDLRDKDGKWMTGLDTPNITEYGKAHDLGK